MRARGLGQPAIPPSASGLISQLNNPQNQLSSIPSNPSEAISHGQNLVNAIQSGSSDSIASLAQAGISFIGSIGGGEYAQVATMASDVLSGALAGASIAGPYGAAVGAVAGLVEGLASAGTFLGVTGTGGVSQATEVITQRVLSYASTYRDPRSNNPQGWAMADWCAVAHPPTISKRESTWRKLAFGALATDLFLQILPNYGPAALNEDVNGISLQSVPNANGNNGKSEEQALCTPVWWNWSTPTNSGPGGLVGNCVLDLYRKNSKDSADSLQNTWIQSTQGVSNTLTQEVIVQRAQQRRPDPLYFGMTLYGNASNSSFLTSGQTIYRNPDGINAMATVLGMLSRGASPMSIVSELSIQAYILSLHGNVFGSTQPNGGQKFELGYPGHTLQGVGWSMTQAQLTVHQLLADYSAMARALAQGANWTGPECWTTPPVLATPVALTPSLTTSSKVGAVAAGAAGALLIGVLGYSAYTRTSPVETARLAAARTGRLFRR
jgi:hypothetical protein